MSLIDSHTHLDSFSDSDISDILTRSKEAGVTALITAGTTYESSVRAVEITSKFEEIFAGIGIHPMDLTGPVDEQLCHRLINLASSSNKVVVMSEIGLDFMEGTPDRAIQYQAFRMQIRVARSLKLPIVFHTREATEETLRVLREEQAYEVGGIMHYFQGDLKTAQDVIDQGFLISLARPLLRLPELQSVASSIPLKYIVLETDSAPQPFKAKRENWTEPRHIKTVASKLAELQNLEFKEVEKITTRNLTNMLGKSCTLVQYINSV